MPTGEGGQGYSQDNTDNEGFGGDAGSGGYQEVGRDQTFRGGINPVWNEALKDVPKEYHNQLLPVFQKWDANHQSGIQKVQSQYAPYKEFVDNGVPADNIRIALGLAQALDENPQAVYQALHQEYGAQFGQNQQLQQQVGQQQYQQQGYGDQGYAGQQDNVPEGMSPEVYQQFMQMQEQVGMMRDIMLHQNTEQQQQQEDKELDDLYNRMSQSNPMFKELNKGGQAEPYMNSLFQAGYNEQQAMQAFSQFVDSVASYNNRPKPPQIMGAGGFMPDQRVRPRDLSEAQTKDMMVQMLRAANHQD
jgi:hypothetical protein